MDSLLKDLARGLGDAQRILDAQASRDIAVWLDSAASMRESGSARDFAGQVHPAPLRLSELRISVDIALGRSSGSGSDVGLNIAGRPVHSFYRSRYGTGETSYSRIEMVCETVPITPKATAQPDQDRETSDGE